MAADRYQRVFVYGAYLPNGGTHMAYHLGRILQRDFGLQAIAVRVGGESPDHGIHAYELRMPQISREEMETQIRDDDMLVVNPSFSAQAFGWRLPGYKLCYAQGFSTYSLLDLKLDHYVASSGFVAEFLRTTYGLDVPVITPFVDCADAAEPAPWDARPADMVQVYRKGPAEAWEPSWRLLHGIVAQRAPHIRCAEPLASNGVPHAQLLEAVAASRYFVTLSPAEGFGLVPLEAMAMGCTVVGYDGYGGREYMCSGENCLVAPYPQIERVAQLLIDAVADPVRAAALAARGRETAARFDYATFRDAWRREFARLPGLEPVG